MRLLRNGHEYKIFTHKESSWCEVRKNNTMLALVMDKISAFQVVYQDIKSEFGECDVLSEKDFKC